MAPPKNSAPTGAEFFFNPISRPSHALKHSTNNICRCGGIGRRKGLKIPRWKHRAGSSPASGTTEKHTLVGVFFRGICVPTLVTVGSENVYIFFGVYAKPRPAAPKRDNPTWGYPFLFLPVSWTDLRVGAVLREQNALPYTHGQYLTRWQRTTLITSERGVSAKGTSPASGTKQE